MRECENCLHSTNEPSEGVCAGCYRSTGIEDEWEPNERVVGLDPIYILEEDEEEYNG